MTGPGSQIGPFRIERELGEIQAEAILDGLSELVVYQDTDMTLRWANRAAAEAVGAAPEDLVGRHCYEIWHQRSSPCEGCPVKQAMETGQPRQGEVVNPQGSVMFVRAYPVRDEKGRVVGAVEVATDITERKRAEEALRQSESRYRGLVEAMREGIWVIDKNSRTTFVNARMADMLGYAAEEMQGRHLFYYLCNQDHLSTRHTTLAIHHRS